MKTLFALTLSLLCLLSVRADTYLTVTNAPIVSTSAYVAGDSLGGVFTLYSSPYLLGQSTVQLQSVTICDSSNQKAAASLLIFNTSPITAGWTLTDHAAAIAPTNVVNIPIKVPVATTDWTTIGGQAFATLSFLNRPVVMNETNTTLYAVWINGGTPTYAVTNAMRFKYVLQP